MFAEKLPEFYFSLTALGVVQHSRMFIINCVPQLRRPPDVSREAGFLDFIVFSFISKALLHVFIIGMRFAITYVNPCNTRNMKS